MAKIKIGEKEFDIDKFNINDIMFIDEKVGDITKLGKKETLRENLKEIRYIVWYALQKKDKNITEEDVGNLINISEMTKFTEDFFEAVGIPKNPTVIPKVSKKQ